MKKNIFIFLVLLALVIFFEWGFWNTYFVQDEWNGFGVVVAMSQKPISSWFNLSTSLHFFPLNIFSWFMMYRAFQYNAQYYALMAIFLQSVASFLVYILTKKLSKNSMVGILTAVLFLTNSRARTAFIHLGVFLNTIPFFIFVISFFFYLTHIVDRVYYGIKDAAILLALFLLAVLYREEGIILIPLLPIYLYIYNKRSLNKKNLKFFITFYGGTVAFFIYRIILQLTTTNADSISSQGYLNTVLYNGLTFPWKLIVQNILDGYYFVQLFLLEHPRYIYPVALPPEIINSLFLDLALFILFVSFVFIFFIINRNNKDRIFWKNTLFSLFFILFSSIALASIGRIMFRVEERYLYLSGFAVLFILASTFAYLFNIKSKSTFLNLGAKALVIALVFFMLTSSYTRIQSDIKAGQAQGKVRKQIISNVVNLYPTIPKKTIFFVKCKNICYRNGEFGLSNNLVLPFSSGPGWILLLQYAKNDEHAYAPFFNRYAGIGVVWYWQEGKFKKVPVKEYLWDMGAQGYRQIGDYGFGYFIDMDLLRKTLVKENLSKNIVIGLEYDEKASIIKDVSETIRKEL